MSQALMINFSSGSPSGSALSEVGPEIPQSAVREIFGALWFKKGTAPDANMSDEDYRQSLNAKEMYKNESNEILSNLMTANILNARNLWVISVMMPLFLTTAQHFHVNHEEWNNLPYTPKAEGGTDNQITFSQWETKDSVGPIVSQSADISVRLSRDNNWGFETWKKNLTQLNKNLTLTLMVGAVQDVRDVAYFQMVHDSEKRFCAAQLFAAEGPDTFLAAKNADAFLDECDKVIAKHPGVHLLVVSPLGSRFLRNSTYKVGTRHLTARELSYNPQLKRLVAKNHQGPLTLMTFELGQGKLDVMEIQPFQTNSDDPTPYNPLATTMSNCQFFGPNPYIKATDRVAKLAPQALDQWISNQTQARCDVQCVDFSEQLANCFYWDKETGDISQFVDNCIAEMNARKVQDGEPAQFRPDRSQNVNDDTGNYATPPLDTKNFTGELHKLKGFRDMPAICMYDPEGRRYRRVERIGDNNLSILPDKWIGVGVEAMNLAFLEQTGVHPQQVVAKIKAWNENCKRAPVTQIYIEKLIDANMPAVLRDGAITVNGLKEFVPNANGSLNLPLNEDGSLTGLKWANGFHSGAGMLTARDFQLQPGSAFTEMCQEAGEALKAVTLWINFLARNVGDSDVINPAYAKPWFLEKNAESTFIDALFPGGEPVFLGVPAAVTARGHTVRSGNPLSPDMSGNPLRTLLLNSDIASITVDDIVAAGGLPETSIEALSCLSADVAQSLKGNFLVDGSQAYSEAVDELFRFIVRTSGYPKKFQTGKETTEMRNTRKLVTAVAAIFFDRLQSDDGTENAKAWIKSLADRAIFIEQRASIMAHPAFASDAPPLAFALVKAQKQQSLPDYGAATQKTVRERQSELREDEEVRDARSTVEYFAGDYVVGATEYMRSSLMSSHALEAFIATTGKLWALPGDRASNYTTPNFRVAEQRRARFEQNMIKQELASPLKSQLSAFQAHLSAMRRGLSTGRRAGSRVMEMERRRRPTAASLYSFSAQPSGDLDDEYDEDEEELYRRSVKSTAYPASDADAEGSVMRQHFYGPWPARMAVAESIKDEFDRLNYKAIIQTPNRLDFHQRQAKNLGVSYINIVMFRPFGRYRVSSAVLMGTGEEVIAKPVSPVDVDISKNRDMFRVECTIEHGRLPIDVTQIHMKYGAFPEAYEGGKNCEFVTDPTQYTTDDQYKPSIIAMPVPKDEWQHAATVHMLNRPLVRQTNRAKRVDPMGKLSCVPFFVSVFGRDACDLAETLQHERTTYNRPCVLSHFAHAGPRTVYDPKTCQMCIINGFGAVNSIEMNSPGCEKVFQQITTEFQENQRAISAAYRAY